MLSIQLRPYRLVCYKFPPVQRPLRNLSLVVRPGLGMVHVETIKAICKRDTCPFLINVSIETARASAFFIRITASTLCTTELLFCIYLVRSSMRSIHCDYDQFDGGAIYYSLPLSVCLLRERVLNLLLFLLLGDETYILRSLVETRASPENEGG